MDKDNAEAPIDDDGDTPASEEKKQVSPDEKEKKRRKRMASRGKVATMLEMVNKARSKMKAAGQQAKSTAALPTKQEMQQAMFASQSSACLGAGAGASPDSLRDKLASQTVPVPRMPTPPKLKDFAPMDEDEEGEEGFGEEIGANLEDISTMHNVELENLDAAEDTELLSGTLTDYHFANKEASEEGQKGFSTADYSRSREGGPEEHSPIEVLGHTEERYEEPPGEVSAEAVAERRQEDALNAECDALLLRLEMRLGVNSAQDGRGEEGSAKIPTVGPVPPASVKALPPRKKTPKAPKAPKGVPSNTKASAVVTAAYLNRMRQEADNDAQNMGDYSIGVDLPTFDLPKSASGTAYSRNLLEQWMAEDAAQNREGEDEI